MEKKSELPKGQILKIEAFYANGGYDVHVSSNGTPTDVCEVTIGSAMDTIKQAIGSKQLGTFDKLALLALVKDSVDEGMRQIIGDAVAGGAPKTPTPEAPQNPAPEAPAPKSEKKPTLIGVVSLGRERGQEVPEHVKKLFEALTGRPWTDGNLN